MAATLADLHETARSMSVEDWCAAWTRAGGGTPEAGFPALPEEAVQRRTNNATGAATMSHAGALYRILAAEAAARRPDLERPRILDFGAGWGRLTRMLLRMTPPDRLSAVEVDRSFVEAMRALLPGVDARALPADGALPYPDAHFDIVLANSVLSHLSPEAHARAVSEIARVTKPGGLFFGTTLGPARYEGFRRTPESRSWIDGVLGAPETVRATLAQGGVVYGPTGRWPDYGVAILPEGRAARDWAPAFEIAGVRTDYSQDVNIAVRTDAPAAPAAPRRGTRDAHAAARAMTVEEWVGAWERRAAGEAVPGLPALPEEAVQRITQSVSGPDTMRHAAGLYRIIEAEVASRFPEVSERRVLDFGAGWGRLARLALRVAPAEAISAVDVDARLVAAMMDLLPGMDVRRIENMRPLPFPDGAFTVVFSNSVFSHLSERAHRFYVGEIARVLRPGGLFLGTTLGWRHYRNWHASPRSRAHFVTLLGAPETVLRRLDREEFVWGDTTEWPDYGIALVPDGWLAAVWGPLFFLPATRQDYTQDVRVAIRKPR